MFGRVEMSGRVFVLRRIAATHMAADHAQPKVDPGVVQFQTLFTAVGARLDVLDLVEMSTAHNSASHGWNVGTRWGVTFNFLPAFSACFGGYG
jgi:hypothetical protein